MRSVQYVAFLFPSYCVNRKSVFLFSFRINRKSRNKSLLLLSLSLLLLLLLFEYQRKNKVISAKTGYLLLYIFSKLKKDNFILSSCLLKLLPSQNLTKNIQNSMGTVKFLLFPVIILIQNFLFTFLVAVYFSFKCNLQLTIQKLCMESFLINYFVCLVIYFLIFIYFFTYGFLFLY